MTVERRHRLHKGGLVRIAHETPVFDPVADLQLCRAAWLDVQPGPAARHAIKPREVAAHDFRVVFDRRPRDRSTRDMERSYHRQRKRDAELLLIQLNHQLNQLWPVAVVVCTPTTGLELR